ncbi:sporulation YhaL family protein [Pontibacillus yanchengensis]|nr:sporulation YhaL family protein [Pontibacillus yanchengensis]
MMEIAGFPWWVLAIILFMIFCGYMAYRAMREDQKMENHFIEQEGQKYMARIEEARQQKDENKEHTMASGS